MRYVRTKIPEEVLWIIALVNAFFVFLGTATLLQGEEYSTEVILFNALAVGLMLSLMEWKNE